MSLGMQVEDPRIVEFDVRTDEMLVNMGPQHPSTHGVLRLKIHTDGEIVNVFCFSLNQISQNRNISTRKPG